MSNLRKPRLYCSKYVLQHFVIYPYIHIEYGHICTAEGMYWRIIKRANVHTSTTHVLSKGQKKRTWTVYTQILVYFYVIHYTCIIHLSIRCESRPSVIGHQTVISVCLAAAPAFFILFVCGIY